MKKAILSLIVIGLVGGYEAYAVPLEKAKQNFERKNKKKPSVKITKAKPSELPVGVTEDPIKREYLDQLNDPDKLSYPDVGNTIATPHTKAEYVDKLVNQMTVELMKSGLESFRKKDLQKRIQTLRDIKKTLK